MDALADEALRAGVVIHTLDITGLSIAGPVSGKELPFSKKTGGIFLKNENFLLPAVALARCMKN